MTTLDFDVRGMKCGGCASRVRRALEALDGVSRVDVALPTAVCVEADALRVTPGQIADLLAGIGFVATAREPAPAEAIRP